MTEQLIALMTQILNISGNQSHGPLSHIKQIKAAASRIDYNCFNYCSTCELKYPKEVLRCNDCNQKVRIRPWHRSKKADLRRI